ncbi:MAG: ABC transporter permease [Anaerolineae bacterium]|nr:ABC transporter permease [Anaerolineae bacterium]
MAAVIPSVGLYGGEIVTDDYRGGGWFLGIDPALLPYLGLEVQRGQLSLERGQMLIGPYVRQNFYDPEATEWQPVEVDLMETPAELLLYKQDGTTRTVDINVVGELREGSAYDYAILMPIQDVIEMNEQITGQEYDPETFRYDQITVQATSRETANEVTEAIRELGFGAGGAGDFLNQLNSFFGTMRLVLGGVGGVALVVAAFGVANTMTMAIIERTREIGLMKAVGATDRDVLGIFLIEVRAGGAIRRVVGRRAFPGPPAPHQPGHREHARRRGRHHVPAARSEHDRRQPGGHPAGAGAVCGRAVRDGGRRRGPLPGAARGEAAAGGRAETGVRPAAGGLTPEVSSSNCRVSRVGTRHALPLLTHFAPRLNPPPNWYGGWGQGVRVSGPYARTRTTRNPMVSSRSSG